MECMKCGVCCIAPDISTLNKPAGVPCKYLGPDFLCTNYENRPEVCRNYTPCEICVDVYDPNPQKRVDNYLKLFELIEF